MTKIMLVCGVPGSGKTTTCKHLQRQGLCWYEPSGERKREILAELGITTKLSELDQTASLLINSLYFTELKWTVEYDNLYDTYHDNDNIKWCSKPILVDTHASYPVSNSFVRLLPKSFSASAVILFNAAADKIRERRISRGRDRDSVSAAFIEQELDYELQYAAEYASAKGIPLYAIDNTESWCYSRLEEILTAR